MQRAKQIVGALEIVENLASVAELNVTEAIKELRRNCQKVMGMSVEQK